MWLKITNCTLAWKRQSQKRNTRRTFFYCKNLNTHDEPFVLKTWYVSDPVSEFSFQLCPSREVKGQDHLNTEQVQIMSFASGHFNRLDNQAWMHYLRPCNISVWPLLRLSAACLHVMLASHLCYRVVGGVGGLHALVATDPHSDVSRLNHAHVVCTVADRERDGLHVFLHHVHNLWLLQRRHSAETVQRERWINTLGVYTAVCESRKLEKGRLEDKTTLF